MPMLSAYTGLRSLATPMVLAGFIGVLVMGAVSVLPLVSRAQDADVYVSAASTTVPADGTQAAPFTTIEAAVAVVPDGGTIHVDNSGAYAPVGTLTLSKPGVTLEGTGEPVIRVSGGTTAFMVSGTGVTVRGFSVQKTDKTSQTIVQIAANDATISNNTFAGQFVIGDGDVSRALVIQGGLTGLTITGNSFADLRQPAYISGVTTGDVSNNFTARTKGWVVEEGNLTFTGNTWGEGANANVYDIAVLATAGTTYYTDIPGLSAANNGAFVEDQRTSPKSLSIVYVDSTVGTSGDGTKRSPVLTLSEALTRVSTGGTIVLGTDVTTSAQTDITKAVTIDGAGHRMTASFSGGSVLNIMASNVTLKNLVEDGGKLSGTTANRGINIYKATGVLLDGVTASNNSKNGIVVNGSTVTAHNITTANNGWEGIDVDLGSGVTTPAELTITGVSQHTETKAAIRIDDITKAVSVVDSSNQYGATTVGNTRDYYFNATKVALTDAVSLTGTSGTVAVSAVIPAGTVVTGSVGWDGVVSAPVATNASFSLEGFVPTVLSAIAVGSTNSDLTLDKAAKLTFAGEAGRMVGWINHAGVFTEITAVCADNTQVTNDGLASGTDCKIDDGSDLVVWTKHFSTFATYRVTQIISSGGSGSAASTASSNTSSVAPVTESAPVTGRVLGAETFSFSRDLTLGSKGDDVMELQTVLITGGFLSLGAPTGTFGPLTRAAVVKYQAAHGLPATGYVGSLTRAALNTVATATPATSDTTSLTKIVELLKQVLELQKKLNAIAS